jgi:hypothetical protein
VDHGVKGLGTFDMDERIADEIGRWVALSERFADEGEMNLSKLLEAAAYARMRRSGWLHRPAVTKATMAQELETSIDRLGALGADDDLVAALQLGSAKLARRDDTSRDQHGAGIDSESGLSGRSRDVLSPAVADTRTLRMAADLVFAG